ncbi:MAG: hypothetical protein AAFN93_25685 [Bacteroidota bacterium]
MSVNIWKDVRNLKDDINRIKDDLEYQEEFNFNTVEVIGNLNEVQKHMRINIVLILLLFIMFFIVYKMENGGF